MSLRLTIEDVAAIAILSRDPEAVVLLGPDSAFRSGIALFELR